MIDFVRTPNRSAILKGMRLATVLCFLVFAAALTLAQPHGQTGGSLQGTVTDTKGGGLAKVAVLIKSDATGKTFTAKTDAEGHYVVPNLPVGSYTVTATATGFGVLTKKTVVALDQSAAVDLPLPVASATSDITVEADATHSIAASLAPMDALLTATSARTEITGSFIHNFTSPISDYGEDVNYAPGTFTLNGNGVGLGQSKTYFRGFPDGDYDIDFDGIPFYDTNTPTHHSWAFFPSQALGGIDFDRSPGTASTIGPTPFGGSIHLLSRDMSPVQNIRATFSGGSFNTYLYDLAYDSGPFGPGHKFNIDMDVHHVQSHGYQTLNNQQYNSGDIKVVYNLNPSTTISGYSGVIWVDANTPNFSATRCQMYGLSASYTGCALANTPTGLYPYTGAGINFLLTNNSDPLLYLDTQYNYYHVPTDFEYVGVHKTFAHHFAFDIKPYTYNYDNSEKYANAVPITDNAALIGTVYAPLGVTITKNTLCSTLVTTTKKGVSYSAEPCGVDKYNSYRKYGETSELTQTTKLGTLRAGMWYEWANTNRHQYPSDPLNHWADQTLPNFAEKFVTDSYQPFAEYAFNIGKKITFTPGVKFAYYTIGTQQFADDGKTLGCIVIGCNYATGVNINPAAFVSNGGSYFATLPSGDVNYRIKSNWSAYFQVAQGSIVPPSSVFDYAQPNTAGTTFLAVNTLPQQQKNTTYQTGTVFKLKRVTFDADYFHIYFDNSYSSVSNQASGGEPVYFAQPASVTQGVEGESNIYFGYGISLYLNASYDSALYTGNLATNCTVTTPATSACVTTTSTAFPTLTAQLIQTAPSGLHVQQTPSDIETEGLTYQRKAWDVGFFNKRVGTQYIDNGQYHNQAVIAPFTLSNAFINYTLRNGGRLDQTRFSVSFNNIFNQSNQTGVTLANSPATQNIAANGTNYVNQFTTTGPTVISGQDNVAILPGRSIMLTVTFGYNPKSRK